MDLGPASMPSQPEGMPEAMSAGRVLASGENLSPHTKSTGRVTRQPRAAALSSSSRAMRAPSLSNSELPISMPSQILRKVYAMPPPMMISSAWAMRLRMSGILSAILAPPRMASSGRRGLRRTASKALSSASSRKPAALRGSATPTIDEWARCAVPKASLT